MITTVVDTENWQELQARVQAARIKTAFEVFRSGGLEPILIKGWAAARNYPKENLRRPGDVDLAFGPDDFAAAEVIVKNSGFPFLIDLHRGLRQLDTLDWDELFDNSILVGLDAAQIRILRPEDHLRVLCVHWLIDGGEYRDKLWDIYWAVENRPPNFDWHRCLDVVEPNRRRWVLCAIILAHRYLNLEVDDLPFVSELQDAPEWVIHSLEREWARNERLEPVLGATHDKRLMARQIFRRMPPNPIRATIEANGDLYGNRRLWYQFGVLGRRTGPFLRDTALFFRNKFRSTAD